MRMHNSPYIGGFTPFGTVDMRPARQEPDAAINRQRVRDGAVALSSDVDSRIPVSIKHKAVGAVVATSLADAVALTCAAVGLTGVCWLNRFNAPSGELCLVSQQFTEHTDGYLMESIVVLLALCAAGAILLLAARGVLLNLLQFLHHENWSVGRVEQGLDGTVAHILAHAVLLPRLLLQSALRGLRAFTLKLAFEVSHLATLAKIVLVAERRTIAGHKEAAHTEVDADGILSLLLHHWDIKGYGEPELTAAQKYERVAGRVAVEEFSQFGIERECEVVTLALRGSRHVDAVLVKAGIEPLVKTHGEILFLGSLGLPLLAVAPDRAQGTAHVAADAYHHLRGQHGELLTHPVVADMVYGNGIQRHAVLLDKFGTGIIRLGSFSEQTQPVVRHLLRGNETDVVRQRWFAFSLAHDVCAIPLYSMGQHSALLWPFELSHRGVSATRHDYCPNGVCPIMLADTTNATCCGGIVIPLKCFSTAKVHIPLDISNGFGYYFQKKVISHGNTAGIPVTEPLKVPFEVSHYPNNNVHHYKNDILWKRNYSTSMNGTLMVFPACRTTATTSPTISTGIFMADVSGR